MGFTSAMRAPLREGIRNSGRSRVRPKARQNDAQIFMLAAPQRDELAVARAVEVVARGAAVRSARRG